MASSSKPRLTRALVALVGAVAIGTGTIGDAPPAYWRCDVAPPAVADHLRGKLLILPGVGNTRFHLAGFVSRATQQLPGFEVEVRTWGTAFLTLHNLRAYERNIATAEQIAADIASWRRAHPDKPFGHRGNHLAYLNPRWQAAKLLPALHPDVGAQDLVARWAQACEVPS